MAKLIKLQDRELVRWKSGPPEKELNPKARARQASSIIILVARVKTVAWNGRGLHFQQASFVIWRGFFPS
jgi:hypothetical protein